jgi:hypothetical protein
LRAKSASAAVVALAVVLRSLHRSLLNDLHSLTAALAKSCAQRFDSRVWRYASSAAVFVLAVAWAAPARADDNPYDPYAAFPLVIPHDKHYVRAGLEEGSIIIVGLVDYLLNTGARGGTVRAGDETWALRYDWPTLRGKLIGTGLNLDSNKFNTNYASHPFAGTLYYTAARSNHLSFAESFLFAALSSTTWEYFGEIREITSINDLVTTPVAGAAIGEAMMQLHGFFRRGSKSFGNDALSFLTAPVASVNEWTDDAEPVRGTLPWHRFVFSAGLAGTRQSAIGPKYPSATYLDERVSLDLALANLPGYAAAGHEARLFDDGNVSNIRLDLTTSGGHLVDALFLTRVVPVGYWWRHGAHGAFLGYRLGFEYGIHDWDRDRARSSDLFTFGSPIGIAAEHAFTSGNFQIRTSLDLYGSFTGITPYAQFDYLKTHTADGLLTTMREVGYYHALTMTAAPAVELAWRSLRLRTELRFDIFRAIEGVDENEGPNVNDSIRVDDHRFFAKTSLSWTLPEAPMIRLGVDLSHAERVGRVGEVTVSRTERSLGASVGVVF